ncbi:MAG: hypothetical protein JKY53_07800 [Flavobacteriales bacterium]|nr:hypothetical protein [Flavobacteriales bacterium]
MNKTSFYTALENLNEIGDIESVVGEFPYFQTARLLYLKKLHNSDDIHFENELKKTAIYAGDRKVLYYLILHKAFTEKLIEIDISISGEIEKTDSTPEKIISTQTIEPKLEPSPLDRQIIEQAVAYSIEKDVEEITAEVAATKTIEEKDEEIDISSLSFTEWLKFTTGRGEKLPKQKSIETLIESFIESEPRIKIPKTEFFSPTELARKSIQDNEDFVTETLAKIYVAQGNYAKAIKAFERLSLNYPEKSTYFADQIESVKDLIKEK